MTKLIRFIRHRHINEYLEQGWTIEAMNNHHGQYSLIAWRWA